MELERRMVSLDQNAAALCNRVEYLIAQQIGHPQKRILIALAGVPGSGKSTLCRAVVNALSTRGIIDVTIVPMDGFHYRQAVLSTFKDPVLAFQKRGAPFTFDAAAFVEFVMKLSTMPVTADGDQEHILQAPSFDHAKQDPIADDIKISSRSKVAIIEGNYTLLNEIPWSGISKIVDDSWFIDVPRETAKQRLVERHIEAGIETSRISATRRVEDNDIPNGEFIKARLIQPDITLLN